MTIPQSAKRAIGTDMVNSVIVCLMVRPRQIGWTGGGVIAAQRLGNESQGSRLRRRKGYRKVVHHKGVDY